MGVIGAGVLSACGNAVDLSDHDIRGGVALGMNEAGEIIAHIEACQFRVVAVEVVAGRELLDSREVNPTLGRIVPEDPLSGRFEVNLSSPQAPWRAEQPLTEPENPEHLIIVSPETDGEVSDAKWESISSESASRAMLEDLAPGEVIVTEYNFDAGPTESPTTWVLRPLADFAPQCPAE